MKAKIPIIILILVCVGLGIGLIMQNKQHTQENQTWEAANKTLSNNWTRTEANLEEQKVVNLTLKSNLDATTTDYSNKLTAAEANLATTSANLTKAQAEAKAAAEAAAAEIAAREKKINELEVQNQTLDKQAGDLRTSITGLEGQISATEKKLAASEGDRVFLLKELKRLQDEKAEMEKKFNDLVVLREQVHKLKEELSISRRLDWIRRGIYGSGTIEKGGERLIRSTSSTPVATSTNHDLNVEIKQDGTTKIQGAAPTNVPAPAPAPAPAPK